MSPSQSLATLERMLQLLEMVLELAEELQTVNKLTPDQLKRMEESLLEAYKHIEILSSIPGFGPPGPLDIFDEKLQNYPLMPYWKQWASCSDRVNALHKHLHPSTE